MAAPTFLGASNGNTDAASPGVISMSGSPGSGLAGNVFIAQVIQEGTTAGISVNWANALDNYSDLAGTVDVATFIGTFNIGSPATALMHLWIGRMRTENQGADPAVTGYGSEDIYCRMYFFSNVSSGTSLATVIENGTAGTATGAAGTSATIADVGVVTLGADRLALNFVGGDDDNALDAFTGMSGGTWAEAVAEYADSAGTDAVLGLQTAAMASAGTINGGTDGWADATDGWGVVGFALIGTTAAASFAPPPASHLRKTRHLQGR